MLIQYSRTMDKVLSIERTLFLPIHSFRADRSLRRRRRALSNLWNLIRHPRDIRDLLKKLLIDFELSRNEDGTAEIVFAWYRNNSIVTDTDRVNFDAELFRDLSGIEWFDCSCIAITVGKEHDHFAFCGCIFDL